MAKQHKADFGCPITTGIFAWIAAHAAAEELEGGRKRVTPYWRTLKTGGEVNPKYPGGVAAQRKLLAAEGHKVVQKGKRLLVVDFETRIARINTVRTIRENLWNPCLNFYANNFRQAVWRRFIWAALFVSR